MDILSSLSDAASLGAMADINRADAQAKAYQSDLTSAAQSGDDKALMDACKEFESYFIATLYKQMHDSTDAITDSTGDTSDDGTVNLFQKSNAEKMFQSMLDDQMAQSAAASGGIGLASFMFKQMQRQQNGVDPVSAAVLDPSKGDAP